MLDFSQYPNYKRLLHQQILAIDFGSQVVGTALFKPGIDPFPYPFAKIVLKEPLDLNKFFLEIKTLINQELVDCIVFGIPYFTDGKSSSQTQKMQEIASSLQVSIHPLPLYMQDETLSTTAAKERMLNSPEYDFKIDPKRLDCLSACIILEDFIRSTQER